MEKCSGVRFLGLVVIEGVIGVAQVAINSAIGILQKNTNATDVDFKMS